MEGVGGERVSPKVAGDDVRRQRKLRRGPREGAEGEGGRGWVDELRGGPGTVGVEELVEEGGRRGVLVGEGVGFGGGGSGLREIRRARCTREEEGQRGGRW